LSLTHACMILQLVRRLRWLPSIHHRRYRARETGFDNVVND